MIDPQRIIALAQEPRRREQSGRHSTDRALTLNGLHGRSDPLARPVAWSAALCTGRRGDAGKGASKVEAARLCAVCPISGDCRSAFLAGAPVSVRRWRQRVDER